MKIFEINKKMILWGIIFLIFTLAPAQSQNIKKYWEKVEIPDDFDGLYLLDIYFLDSDPNYGWVCGYYGITYRTTDGGDTWRQSRVSDTYQLESIHFPTKDVGYTSGGGAIYKSTNGGDSWFEITPIDDASMQGILLWGNYFITEDYGLVIGGNCDGGEQRFYLTTNGGQSWQMSEYYEPGSKLADAILFEENGEGYAVGSGLLWRTMDGGRNWERFSYTGGNDWHEDITKYGSSFLIPYSVSCNGDLDGNGGARFTTNMGQTWNDSYFGESCYGSFLINETTGWVCGRSMAIFHTTNAGFSWELIDCGITPGTHVDDMYFFDDTTGFVVGEGIFKYHQFYLPEIEVMSKKEISICREDTVKLFLNNYLDSIRWSDGVEADTLYVTEPGKYYAHVWKNECVFAYSDTIEVNIFEKPDTEIYASSQGTYCEGDTVFLSLNDDFVSIEWSTGENDNEIMVTESGVYEVSVVDSNGCQYQNFFEVFFEPNPRPEISVLGRKDICRGDSVIIEASEGFAVYNWYQGNKESSFSNNRRISVTEPGEYYVTTVTKAGCANFSDTVKVTVRLDSNRIQAIIGDEIDEFTIDSTYYPDIKCTPLTVFNYSNEDYVLDEVYFFKKLAFSAPVSQFPLVIPANDSINLKICYSPTELTIQRDTLLMPDVCTDHILPLKSRGLGRNYIENTKCDVPVNLETVKIGKSAYISYEAPFPNPANSSLIVPYVLSLPDGQNIEIYAKLVNMLGKTFLEGKGIPLETNRRPEGTVVFGQINLNTSKLPGGVYFLIGTNPQGTEIFKVSISK